MVPVTSNPPRILFFTVSLNAPPLASHTSLSSRFIGHPSSISGKLFPSFAFPLITCSGEAPVPSRGRHAFHPPCDEFLDQPTDSPASISSCCATPAYQAAWAGQRLLLGFVLVREYRTQQCPFRIDGLLRCRQWPPRCARRTIPGRPCRSPTTLYVSFVLRRSLHLLRMCVLPSVHRFSLVPLARVGVCWAKDATAVILMRSTWFPPSAV